MAIFDESFIGALPDNVDDALCKIVSRFHKAGPLPCQ